jgi:DNA-binding response OmpR family regulator
VERDPVTNLRRPTRILVVDDERFFREAIRELLEGEGLGVRLAQTAAEALEGAADPQVGVVVLDIQLPDGSGLDVLRTLRARRPELRVVMLSAHTDQEYVLEALRLGACDYLAKPLHEEEMRLSVGRALEAHALGSRFAALRGRLAALAGEAERATVELAGEGPEAVAGRVAELAARLLGAARTSVMLREPSGERLRVVAATGHKGAVAELDPVPVGSGVAGTVVARNAPLRVEDAGADPRFPAAHPGRYETGSFLAAPLAATGGAFGAVCVTERREGGAFEEEDLALLRLLALAFVPLLAPVRAAAAPDAPAAPAEDDDAVLAREVCDAAVREVEPARVLGAVLVAASERLHAAPVSLYLLDVATDTLRREAQWEADGPSDRPALPRGRGLTGAACTSGQPVASGAPAEDPRFDAAVDTPEGGGTGPLLAVPLRFRGRTLGVFRAFPARPEAAAPRTAEVLGAALSAVVRNVLLYRSLVESIEDLAQARREGEALPGAPHR